mmetsp:Transcript_75292/g.243774  ORF Transcript_75292/g.243774 Transcript_75292/m.243774 type:complete len:124 (+) Transcript_75292:545-916(+)
MHRDLQFDKSSLEGDVPPLLWRIAAYNCQHLSRDRRATDLAARCCADICCLQGTRSVDPRWLQHAIVMLLFKIKMANLCIAGLAKTPLPLEIQRILRAESLSCCLNTSFAVQMCYAHLPRLLL